MSKERDGLYGGVDEVRFLEAYPLPWSIKVHPSLNRTEIRAADGTQIISGMNNAKAAFIVDAVNRRDD